MNIVDKERWLLAQKNEVKHHSGNFDFNITNKNHYYQIYEKVFRFINPEFKFNVKNKRILEIGPGVYSCLLYCSNVKNCAVVEPMELPQDIQKIYKKHGVKIYQKSVEEIMFDREYDEVWIFNVMQHIWNPSVFLDKLKQCSGKILFFEPINTEINDEHVYSYTKEDYENLFSGTEVKLYTGRSIDDFHSADCVYGIWNKENE